jgi:predicted Holliday junction resolvase-like endonuclease
MTEWALILCLLVCLIVLFYIVLKYISLRDRTEKRAQEMYLAWKSESLELEARQMADLYSREWKMQEEGRIRKDAVAKSEAVIRGKVTEHLIPFFPDFPYYPQDARFLGTPVDFIVFDGLASGEVKSVIFVEVKSGKTPTLSSRERKVRDCIQAGNVRYETIHLRNGNM